MMLRIILCLTFVGSLTVALAQTINLQDVRKDFSKGIKDKSLCERYWKNLEKHSVSTVEKGYAAAFHMFMAKHTSNPFKKMSYFNGGQKKLEELIKKDPTNVELRFIRLCIQYYVPKYLGYRDNIEEDKDYLVQNLRSIKDANTKEILFNYLKGANMYSEKELALLAR